MNITQQFYQLTQKKIKTLVSVSGGDICTAYRAILHDGQKIFIKTHKNAHMLSVEADGLKWLQTAQTIAIPTIIAVANESQSRGLLALEWIEPTSPTDANWETFGRQLAWLHKANPGFFGFAKNNYLGHLKQSNIITNKWVDFFRTHRLLTQIELAIDTQRAPANLAKKFEPLLNDLESLLGNPTPAYLHGDLWSGNHVFSATGVPYLIDPSVYAGHREVDIAMMKLFGGFSERTFSAYQEIYPLQSGWEHRILIYQLYYLLAHVNLHGSGWLRSVLSVLKRVS